MGKLMGTVKFFDAKKGYGSIAGNDGKNYFFFYRDILRKNKYCRANEKVLFTTIKDARGVRAVGVSFGH